MEKPKVRCCWSCGRKLRGNHHVLMIVPLWSGDKIPRTLHKECGKRYTNGENQYTFFEFGECTQ